MFNEVNCITNRATKLFNNTCVKFNQSLLKNINQQLLKSTIIYWDSYNNNNHNILPSKHYTKH